MSVPLPSSLDLPPHLSAQKYFLVCTLTVAAWDTLVLSPRTWRLFRSPGWPPLKILYHFLRIFMPLELTVVAVAFFDTKWTASACDRFYLFEPICTAILLAAVSAVHVIRIHAMYDKNDLILAGMSALFVLQVVVTGVAAGFYRATPLLPGQGCIASPKHPWVGVYWLAPTLFFAVSFSLALARSVALFQTQRLSPWKLMLRGGLNFYGAILIANVANMLTFFIITPTGPEDPIRTIAAPMATVLSTTMTMRIVLTVRGPLVGGGTYYASSSGPSSRGTHVISGRSAPIPNGATTYTLDEIRAKPAIVYGVGEDGDSGQHRDAKSGPLTDAMPAHKELDVDVRVTVDKEVE